MFDLIPAAHAQTAAQAPQEAGIMQLVMIVGMVVFFYFIIIRPQRKQQKEHKEMIGGLQVGDEVVTTAGMLGKIRKINDDFAILKVSDNVELKFQKASLHSVLPKGTIKSIDG
jgi:preprotein translocase subunit YajC